MAPYFIFMDIDGTLVDDHQQASRRTIETLNRLHHAGHRLFIATGRMLDSGRAIAQTISPTLEVIASNGAVIAGKNGVTSHLLGKAGLTAAFNACRQYQLSAFFFTTQRTFYTNLLPDYFSGDAKNRVAGTLVPKYAKTPTLESLLAHQGEIVNGIIIDDQNPQKLPAVAAKLKASGALATSSSAPNNIELMPKGVNKAAAIKQLCQKEAQPLARTIAFGDGMNDLEMLKAVGIGVAMGNAKPALKQAVSHQTLDNYHDGVAVFLERFLGGQTN